MAHIYDRLSGLGRQDQHIHLPMNVSVHLGKGCYHFFVFHNLFLSVTLIVIVNVCTVLEGPQETRRKFLVCARYLANNAGSDEFFLIPAVKEYVYCMYMNYMNH